MQFFVGAQPRCVGALTRPCRRSSSSLKLGVNGEVRSEIHLLGEGSHHGWLPPSRLPVADPPAFPVVPLDVFQAPFGLGARALIAELPIQIVTRRVALLELRGLGLTS